VNGQGAQRAKRTPLFRPAIFGLGDGCMSIVGVVLYLLGDQRLIFPAALSGAISAALSMSGNEYLSDSDNGFWPSAVMGTATATGGIAPAIPFLFTTGALALEWMGVICLLIGVIVGVMRARECRKHTFWQELGGTLGIFILIFAAVFAASLALPASGLKARAPRLQPV
jgi:VIT1/CCC1 family predicted Fe2+/Mn2+ transporter